MNEIIHPSRMKLLEATLGLIREQGYAATTVEDICRRAGVSKGSFFHHFKSKEELILGAVEHWNQFTTEVFEQAPYQSLADPRDRILGYVDFRMAILDFEVPEFTCLLGTLVQETYQSHPSIREACDFGMSSHIGRLAADLEQARAHYAPDADWTAESVGYFIQAVLQGAFIFAKAKLAAETARENLRHLRRYLEMILPAEC
ncbi:transcriptional regulator, TetR family [Rhizobium sp. PDO1-076]|mgnify:CR=1 FL=1|uniref:TetR/AcrR family transcriptional regulator n=1 Tax=Rhizobium sp. PDO1-076 TaxID=1125979 RepID=UPI00024E2719|nr:TetR/AcrR family transcriptional regulator [Rhizobium sp. PDO1-076]EHS53702.1 transcriptional regulator, TetR family [Rhizobium sp. PDO1-076]